MSENLNSVILTNEKDKTDMKEQENIIASESQNEASEQVKITQITIDEDFKKLFSRPRKSLPFLHPNYLLSSAAFP